MATQQTVGRSGALSGHEHRSGSKQFSFQDSQPWILLGLVLLSHWSIGIKYISRFWSAGHYQYYPLVFAAVVWLFWTRRDEISQHRTTPSPSVLTAWLLVDLFAVVFATLIDSSALGVVSFILALMTAIYWCVGSGGLRRCLPLVFLLCFAIPLPFGLDQELIIRLQFLASQSASLILDAIGQIHFRTGVVLITPTNRFLTEEACSGIRSLFSSMTAIAIFGVVNRYPWWRHLFNLIQVVFWVIVGNTLRVATVIYVTDHYTDWIASGIGHDLLGLFVFLFIFAMAVSTDCLVTLFINVREYFARRYEDVEDGDPNVGDDPLPRPEESPGETVQDSSLGMRPTTLLGAVVTVVFLVLFAAANLLGARVAYARYWNTPTAFSYQWDRLPVPVQEHLPAEIGKWKMVGFEHVHRPERSLQAQDSYLWEYSDGNLSATVSVDCPWFDWHNLDFCYSALGWETEPEFLVAGESTELNGLYSRIQMKRDGQWGFVAFRSVDRDGNAVLPTEAYRASTAAGMGKQVWDNIARSLAIGQESLADLRGVALPATTLQLFCSSGSEFSEEEIDSLVKLHSDSTRLILNSPRYNAVDKPHEVAGTTREAIAR